MSLSTSNETEGQEIVFEAAGPFYIAFIDDMVVWVDSREEDGAFHTHKVEPSNKFSLQKLTKVSGFEMVLGETDDGTTVLFLVDRLDNYCYGVNLTKPEDSRWGFCPL